MLVAHLSETFLGSSSRFARPSSSCFSSPNVEAKARRSGTARDNWDKLVASQAAAFALLLRRRNVFWLLGACRWRGEVFFSSVSTAKWSHAFTTTNPENAGAVEAARRLARIWNTGSCKNLIRAHCLHMQYILASYSTECFFRQAVASEQTQNMTAITARMDLLSEVTAINPKLTPLYQRDPKNSTV